MGETLKKKSQELTKAELEIMQVIWQKEKVLVHDILAKLPEPKPAYNTVSTIVRILENKGFVSHKAYGRTYEYFPIVGKEEYTNTYMRTVLDNFFEGSVSRMVNFFSAQKSLSLEEADEILKILSGDNG
ncbi:MAG: BlaI/MecI/CopY family transcriptional regulator [Bacteroidales bacterium]|nr:BlaI/MecI/CopY family transcriptional regulator [Bacteroidales bacterium]